MINKLCKSLKFALASVIAIALANLLGLKYATTAGIITILSIQNTKKETLKIAARRAAAFVCALVIAAVSFGILGFSIIGFAVYLFAFSCVCLFLGWPEAISMCSVLVLHFLTERGMEVWLLWNETLLFVIGAGMGILANLHLHRKSDEFDKLALQADEKMKQTLRSVEKNLLKADTGEEDTAYHLEQLDVMLSSLRECAHRNWNNTFLKTSVYETEYVSMRIRQAEVLHHIHNCMGMMESIPEQARMVAKLLSKIEKEYERNNTVETLLEELFSLYESMRQEPLPQSREEFEARAVLFYILKQIEDFLKIKRAFITVI